MKMNVLTFFLICVLLSTNVFAYEDAPRSVTDSYYNGLDLYVKGDFNRAINVLDELRRRIFRQYGNDPSLKRYDTFATKAIAYSYAYKYIRNNSKKDLASAARYFKMAVAKDDKWSKYALDLDKGTIPVLRRRTPFPPIIKDHRGVVRMKPVDTCVTDLPCFYVDVSILSAIGGDESAVAVIGEDWYTDNKCLRERLLDNPGFETPESCIAINDKMAPQVGGK